MDKLAELYKQADRTRARVVGAAQIALWYFEAQNFDATERILREALAAHNVSEKAIFEYLKNLPASPAKENQDGNQHAAA